MPSAYAGVCTPVNIIGATNLPVKHMYGQISRRLNSSYKIRRQFTELEATSVTRAAEAPRTNLRIRVKVEMMDRLQSEAAARDLTPQDVARFALAEGLRILATRNEAAAPDVQRQAA
mgnify:FL=1